MKRWLAPVLLIALQTSPCLAQEQARVFDTTENILERPPLEVPEADQAVTDALDLLKKGNRQGALVRLQRLKGEASQDKRVQVLMKVLMAPPGIHRASVPPEVAHGLQQARAQMDAGDYAGALLRIKGLADRFGLSDPMRAIRAEILMSDRLSAEEIATIEQGQSLPEIELPGAHPTPDAQQRAAMQAALVDAVERGDRKAFDDALSSGADLNACDAEGNYPLTAAVVHRPALVPTLLRRGAHPNPPSKATMPPLNAATAARDERLMALLLKSGAKINAQDSEGHTPLKVLLSDDSWGQESQRMKNLTLLQTLMNAGADWQANAPDGQSALSVAAENTEMPQDMLTAFGMPNPKTAVATMLNKLKPAPARKAAARGPVRMPAGGPIEAEAGELSRNSVGTPAVSVHIANHWTKPIDAYRIELHCWDTSGRPMESFGRTAYMAVSRGPLAPGAEITDTWLLSGYENAAKVTAEVVYVRFKDGSAWRSH